MAGTILHVGMIKVFIGAEDHPPPHVHAFHSVDRWLARFRFSFLSDITGLYRFKRRGRKPTNAILETIAAAIIENLPACREAWWETHGARHGLGLVNRRVETLTIPSGIRARVALVPGKGAVSIVSAAYNNVTRQVSLILGDGRKLVLAAGKHIEEAEEW